MISYRKLRSELKIGAFMLYGENLKKNVYLSLTYFVALKVRSINV